MSKIAPTYSEFIAIYPAFVDMAQPLIESALSLSSRLLDSVAWGDFYSDAVGLDVAHSLSLSALSLSDPLGAFQGAVGPVNSVSAAGVSTSFTGPDIVAGGKSDQWYSKNVF